MNRNGKKYDFVTITELANIIKENNYAEKTIDFTGDIEEDIRDGEEPTGWYGLKVSHMFDGHSLLVGYYGDGVFDFVDRLKDMSDEHLAITLARIFSEEFSSKYTPDSKICIDTEIGTNC